MFKRHLYLPLIFLAWHVMFPLTLSAADAVTFNPLAIQITPKGAGGGVPVGTVIAWPTASSPSGQDSDKWLECNGQSINQAAYPELFAVIGGKIPDYRGVFLRGYGSQTSDHFGYVTHSSGGIGQLQGDAIRNIYGEFEFKPRQHGSRWPSGAFANIENTGSSEDKGPDRPSGIYFSASYVVPVANENRPVNMAVRFFIRAKP